MTKGVLGKATFIALAGLFAAAVVPACSTESNQDGTERGNVGSIGLNMEIAPGVVVDVVTYEVSGNGITPVTGTIPIASLGSTVSALVGGLPAGSGYVVTLTATSVDGLVECIGTSTPFDIIADSTVSVSIDMQCSGEETRGEVTIGGTFNSCPVLTSYTIAPLQVPVGGEILLTAAAADLDDASLTFAWTATTGSFDSASSANTNYNCDVAGTPTLTLTVSDGSCEDTADVQVTCIAVACGNGTVDPGETCDDGNTSGGDACPADCTLPICGDNVIEGGETCDDGNTVGGDACPVDCTLAVCGDGTVEAPEGCEPPGTPSCSATCTSITGCGNGILEAGEDCDDGNNVDGDTCPANCQNPECGNGIVEPGEQCDPPNSINCSATCQTANSVCTDCEANTCPDRLDTLLNTSTPAPGITPPKSFSQLATEILECARTNDCDGTNPHYCYCGDGVDLNTCLGASFVPNGDCKTIIEDGARSADGTLPTKDQVAERYFDPAYPTGAAFAVVSCDVLFCSGDCGPFGN